MFFFFKKKPEQKIYYIEILPRDAILLHRSTLEVIPLSIPFFQLGEGVKRGTGLGIFKKSFSPNFLFAKPFTELHCVLLNFVSFFNVLTFFF